MEKGRSSGRNYGDFVDGYLRFVDNTEPSELFKKWTCFSLISAALRRKVWLTWQERLYPNLFVLLVGPPASRKGSAMAPALSILRELGLPMAANSTTRAALVKALKNSYSGLETGTNGVVTPHSSLTIFNKELTTLIGFGNKEFISDLCDFYDCDPRWKKDTTTQGVYDITNIWLNLIGATTPKLLTQSCPPEIVGSGFISRSCSIYAPGPGKIVQVPMMKKVDGQWVYFDELTSENNPERKAIVHDFGMISLLSGQFKLDNTWIEEWCKWYGVSNIIKAFEDTPLEDYNGRRQVHAQKLSMILSASRSDDMIITGKDLTRAIEFLEEAEERMLDVFSGFGGGDLSEATNKMMKIVGQLSGPTHYNELFKHFFKDIRREEFQEVLRNLQSIGFLELSEAGVVKHIPKQNGVLR